MATLLIRNHNTTRFAFSSVLRFPRLSTSAASVATRPAASVYDSGSTYPTTSPLAALSGESAVAILGGDSPDVC